MEQLIVKEYIILKETDHDDLVRQVKWQLTKGYQPFGGVSSYFNTNTNTHVFLQAMVKY